MLALATVRARAGQRAGERGSLTLELAVVFPVVLAVVVLTVQAGLYFYARQVALDAARRGVSAARVQGSNTLAGLAAAQRFAIRAGAGTLLAPQVSAAGSSPTLVRIRVAGRAPSLLPGLAGWPLSAAVTAPVERFTTGIGIRGNP